MTTLSCSKIEELIAKVIDREALDWEVDAVKSHLPTCASCTELRDGMIELGGFVRSDIASAVASTDFSGLMAKIDAGIDRAAAKRDSDRMKSLLFSWPAFTRWVATGAVAAAFAFAMLMAGNPLHDFESADNRIEISSIEGGTDNTVMIYESEEDNVTFIWVIEDERAL